LNTDCARRIAPQDNYPRRKPKTKLVFLTAQV
jgi:hypothetical protein